MKDKDKIFLVFYVNVSHIHPTDIPGFIEQFSREFRYDETVSRIIVPVQDEKQGSRVECINPVLLTEDQYKEVEEKIKNLQNEVEEAIRKLKNE